MFLFAIFAYPLGFAVYMSFFDYFFAAPGAIVERPFVGLDNYTTALSRPGVPAGDAERGRVHRSSTCPLTVFVAWSWRPR